MQNVDPAEIQKFNALANSWWDEKGPSKPLHALNPPRLQFITDAVSVKDKSILDIGCGGGLLCESLAKRGAQVTGIDAAADLITVAKEHAAQSTFQYPIEYQVQTAESFAETGYQTFDIITCMELLEHVPDPLALVKVTARLVKPGGHVFFSTLNRTPKTYLFAILGAEYIFNLLPKGTHQYEKLIRPAELEAFLSASQLRLKSFGGLQYNPLTNRATLKQGVEMNYLAHAIKATE